MTSALHPARDFGTLPRSVSYTHAHSHSHPHSHSHSHSHSQGHNAASAALPLLPRRLPLHAHAHAQSASAPVSRRASPSPSPSLPSPPAAPAAPNTAPNTHPTSAPASPPATPIPTAVVVQPPTPPTPTAAPNTNTNTNTSTNMNTFTPTPTTPAAIPILASLAPPPHTHTPPNHNANAAPDSGTGKGTGARRLRGRRTPFPTSTSDADLEPRATTAPTPHTTTTTTTTSATTAPHQHQQKLLLLTPDPQRAAPRPLRHSVPTRLALTPIHAPTPVLASAPAFASASLSLSTPTLAGTPASPAWSPSPSSSGSGSLASIPRKKSGEPLKSSLKSRRPLVRGSLSVLTALSTTTTTNTPASSRATSPHPHSPGPDGAGTGAGASTRSAPATPGLSAPKNVHFDAQLARVRLYFAGQRPLAVSRGGSPTADAGSGTESEGLERGARDEDEDGEEDESGEGEGEYRVEMRWVDGPGEIIGDEDARDVVLESLKLDCGDPTTTTTTTSSSSSSSAALLQRDPPATPGSAAVSSARLTLGAGQQAAATLRGLVRVRNVAFEKWVGARFTLDGWQTVSEVSARYVAPVRRLSSVHGGKGRTEETEAEKEAAFDRFAFAIRVPLRVGKQAAAEPRTLALALRYRAAGREMWDNNGGRDYTVQVAAAREAKACAGGGRERVEGRSGEGERERERGFDVLRGKLERLEARQSQSQSPSASQSQHPSASASPSHAQAHIRAQSQSQGQGRSLGQGQTVGGLLARGAPRYDFADSLRSAGGGGADGGVGAWRGAPGSPARVASPSRTPTISSPGGLQAHQRTSTYPASAPSPRGGAAQRSRGATMGVQYDYGVADEWYGSANDDGHAQGHGYAHIHEHGHGHAHGRAHGRRHSPRRQPFAGDVGFNFGFGGAAGRGGLGIEFGSPRAAGAVQGQQQGHENEQGQQQERLSAHWAPPRRARTPSPLHTPLHTPTTTESDTDTEAQRITLVTRHPHNPHQHQHQQPPAPASPAHAHAGPATPRRHTRGGYFDGAGMSGVRRTPPGSPFLRYNSFPPASPAPALAAAEAAMLSPGWAGAMGRQREMARAGGEGGDGGENGTIGRAQGRFVRRLGTDSPVHHLSNYDELLNRFCFYTGRSSPDPDARFEPPADHVPRSHSTSSIDEILAAQSPRAASARSPDLTPRAGGWGGGSSGSATPLATLTPTPARTRAGFRQLGQTPSLAV